MRDLNRKIKRILPFAVLAIAAIAIAVHFLIPFLPVACPEIQVPNQSVFGQETPIREMIKLPENFVFTQASTLNEPIACRQGKEKGENLNFQYCPFSIRQVDQEGNILSGEILVKPIADNNGTAKGIACEAMPEKIKTG